ncbi:hypothetical protein MRB53_014744 [Persea americana]|uniref:Uncharacterized protein n=1 Tax=Persea americana TaxID=3435 RepID=A0ACC2KBX6_PERAE|nr:hypothetical protein MRB53_014744 [Persea americana]
MGFSRPLVGCFLLLTVTIGANAQPIVPALIVFGDSMNDVGNNNKLVTIAKSSLHVISLSKQLEYYKEYQSKVVSIARKENASSIFSGAFYMLSAGIADFVLNYYINPLLNIHYTQDQFSEILVHNFATELYNLGARKAWVMSLPPLGCLPVSITLFGSGSNKCVERINSDALQFNNKLIASAQGLQK